MNILIIGSGIAGLVAAIEAYNTHSNAFITIIEKESKIGGNSLKATSGISLCKYPKDVPLFIYDTLKSGHGNPKLVNLMAYESLNVLRWLKEFDIELPIVSQCGGHSVARTFTNYGNKNVGTYLVEKLVNYIQKHTNIVIFTNTRVINVKQGIITTSDGSIISYNAIILATGGYSSNKSLLLSHYKHLPSTNGDFATGDGLYFGMTLGGQLIDMDKVQVHPTFFVKEPILAPEALRACGGILVNKHGQQFIDELQPRDVIVNAWPHDNLVWLVVNQDTITRFGISKFTFYLQHGIFSKIIPKNTLYDTLTNIGWNLEEPVWIAQVQPAVHYTMGGLEIDCNARVVGTDLPIYAAGEVIGGIHGKNRLAGNSLLETIVFGRIAGRII